VRRLGRLDVLVNAAGVLQPPRVGAAERSGDEGSSVQAEVEINLLGSMRMTRLALPRLQAAGGTVVFFSSALALTAAPGLASYAATKAAIHSYARSLRAELAGEVGVVEVVPPFVDTGLSAGIDAPKVSADAVAAAIIDGLERGRVEIRVGRVVSLARLARLWPSAADRIIAGQLHRT
jgi:short-subunit dehydrogenase involved in D-alanine esterification of teichoic acids